jgi:epoxyqueuosine reductase
MKTKILLHTCCAPCLSYTENKLKEKFEVYSHFCGSNIHPYSEYNKRREALLNYTNAKKIHFIEEEYSAGDWFDFLNESKISFKDLESNKIKRCELCYIYRLEKSAKYAKENNFKFISSTLFYSIYQFHDLLKECLNKISNKYNLEFYYEDFRTGWQKGFQIYKPYGLYLQKYCGCVFSEEERLKSKKK